jgi:hypothetical protein
MLNDDERPITDVTHLIWFAVDQGLGVFVGAPEDLDEGEEEVISAVFGFRPAKVQEQSHLDPEPIPWPSTSDHLVCLALPPPLSFPTFAPNWEELEAREVVLNRHDGHLSSDFTLWVIRQHWGLLLTSAHPEEQGEHLKNLLSLHEVARFPSLPEDARPILRCRPDGGLVRLWPEVPRGRKPLERIRHEGETWRWENRPYVLVKEDR